MSANVQAEAAQDAKQAVTVRIFGSEYPIAGGQDPQYVEELARIVDSKMRDIAKGSALLSAGKLAVLAALNMADELLQLRASQERLKALSCQRIDQIRERLDKYLGKV